MHAARPRWRLLAKIRCDIFVKDLGLVNDTARADLPAASQLPPRAEYVHLRQ